MNDDTPSRDERTIGCHASVDDAIRLWERGNKLIERARMSLTVAASLSDQLTYEEHLAICERLRAVDFTGRSLFTNRSRYMAAMFSLPPGEVTTRQRGVNLPWPRGHFVYVLIDANGRVLYVGQSSNLGPRIAAHNKKPWRSMDIYSCATPADALRLESDLIFQHQPSMNTAGRSRRRYVA